MNKTYKTFRLLLIVLILFIVSANAQFNTTKYPSKDCALFDATPNNNFGSGTIIAIQHQSYNGSGVSLLYFDLSSIPQNAIIESAYLNLNCMNKTDGVVLRIGRLEATTSWTETGVTWNNMPWAWEPPNYKYFTIPNIDYSGYNVKEFVQAWVAGTYSNNGFQLFTESSEASASFYSREMGTSYTPKLIISYSIPSTEADIAVSNLTFLPQTINHDDHPSSVSYRITNYGPSDLTVSSSDRILRRFYISKNNIFGDQDDIEIGRFNSAIALLSGNYSDRNLSSGILSDITIPSVEKGDYYVFLEVQFIESTAPTDPNSSNNYAMRTGTILTAVNDEQNPIVLNYSVEQNYPNPFNPSTTISYQIPSESFVTLKVYDLLGRELEVLVNEEKPAGFYDVKYNAAYLPSGIYFYSIKAGDFVQTKKFILLK